MDPEGSKTTTPEGVTVKPEGTTENDAHKEHLAKLIRERDEAKARAKSLEDERQASDRKTLEDQQKWKELYEQQLKQLEKLPELEARVKAIDERADARIAELSGKLPEASKAEYDAFISILDRDKRLEWLMSKTSATQAVVQSPAASRATAGQQVDPTTLSLKERAEWAMKDPVGFRKAMGR